MSAQKYKDIYQDGSAARNIYTAAPVPDEFYDEYDIDEADLEMGYNPYLGGYDYDC